MAKATSEETKAKIHELRARGLFQKEIAAELGISKSVVQRCLSPTGRTTVDSVKKAKYDKAYYVKKSKDPEWRALRVEKKRAWRASRREAGLRAP